ncbi:unnamed protein product [Acanthoscelides obtectus]|uniref:Uncharacterized protein n=2 Tax=Acanthoscelides obtectus TaxID=200917 RepID=A0A9P0Q974_ACAOB|nr:unnamed protein product [Acanthoscelides obtectus]CAK1633605.1 Major facilitator superfamily domain-containing protein 9 [Acanthoscelides obtectus]
MFYIYCIFALDAFSLGTYLAIQPKHVIQLGGTFFTVGLLKSLIALLAIFSKASVVHISNKNNKQNVMVWCLLFSVLGNVLSAATSSVLLYFVARLICVASIPVQAILKSEITKHSKDTDESSKVLMNLETIGTVGFMVGRVIGGYSGDYVRGNEYVYMSMIGNILISIVLVKSLPEEDSKQTKDSKKSKDAQKNMNIIEEAWQEMSSLFTDLSMLASSQYKDVFAIKLFVEYVSVINFNALGTTLNAEYRLPMATIGYCIVFNMTVPIVASWFVGTVRSRYYAEDSGYLRVRHFTTVIVATYAISSVTSDLPVFILAITMNSAAKSFIDSALDDLLHLKIEADQSKGKRNRTTIALKCFNNINTIAQLIGPLTSGILSCMFSIRSNFLACALFMILTNRLSKT